MNNSFKNPWLDKDQFIINENNNFNSPIIMIHGFTGSPFDFKPLAEALSFNYNIIIPVVPGQTKNYPILSRGAYTSDFYTEWLDKLIVDTIQKFGKKPYLVGFSMGGTISTIISDSNKIKKLILISPFYELVKFNNLLLNFAKVLKFFLPVIPKLIKNLINDPIGYKNYQSGSMSISIKSFIELEKLAKSAIIKAKYLNIPILILFSKKDQVSSYKKIVEIFSENTNIKLVSFVKSNHMLLYDYDRHSVISKIVEFIQIEDD